jgi:hypothetical protein
MRHPKLVNILSKIGLKAANNDITCCEKLIDKYQTKRAEALAKRDLLQSWINEVEKK